MLRPLIMLAIAGLLLLVGWGAYLEYLVRYWDARIAALCIADGGKNVGLRVYERVIVPPNYIRPATGATPASIFVPWKTKYSTPRVDEPILEEFKVLETLRSSQPAVARYSVRLVRVADSKVLAEEIGYMRSGGGIPMPTPSDRFICPGRTSAKTGGSSIYVETFINHPSNSRKGATE